MNFSINAMKNTVKNIFGKQIKNIPQEAKRISQKTEINTCEETGVTKFERLYTDAKGKSYYFTVETKTLEDGAKQTKTKVQGVKEDGSRYTYADEGVIKNREKKVKREKNASILGGDKITIDKEYHETMAETAHTEKMVKEFDKKNRLQHKDYTLKYRHWNKPKHGTQDRVYNEAPLNHSAKDITDVNPNEHTKYKHSWDGNNNYHHFEDGAETKYSKAIAAQEQARINAAKAAEEAKIAAEKAKAEYEKTLPIVNTNKVLGLNIDELERFEQTQKDGTIVRVYTKRGVNEPVIITEDKGLLHKEWIHGGKTDFLYIKKIGDEKYPYMLAEKDGYTFISRPCKGGGLFEEQFRYDGIRSYKGTSSDAELKIPYKETQQYKNSSDDMKAYYDDNYKRGYSNNLWHQNTYRSDMTGPEVKEEYENAKKCYIKLYDLIKPYEG